MGAIKKTGVLLVNLGTPDAPTEHAVRTYLDEFLSDPRVVKIPRVVWWVILHLLVLRLRPKKSAEAYRQIWMQDGSPLMVFMKRIRESLQRRLEGEAEGKYVTVLSMRYGNPGIQMGLESLRDCKQLDQILILPLYPQYSAATTGSTFDAVAGIFRKWEFIPSLRYLSDYHCHPVYITALAAQVCQYWDSHASQEFLLLSFHGLPEKSIRDGDPYFDQCQVTAKLLADRLQLADEKWEVVFQSRFGRAEWLKPYCVSVLAELPAKGVRNVDVFCPGFSVDCLETLEEIALTNRRVFVDAGGEQFRYIPALNDSPAHLEMLRSLILENT